MAITRLTRGSACLGGLLCSILALNCTASPGLATRDLNPVLQSIYLPAYRQPLIDNNWRFSQTLFITNTAQKQDRGNESLRIDVENYRIELALEKRRNDWVMQLGLPLILNRGGLLDSAIQDWHEFFGLPEGNRPGTRDDQIDIEYLRDGNSLYRQNSASSGLGDLSLAIGYHPPAAASGYFIGIELPSGCACDYSGNESLDLAVWMQHSRRIDEELGWYGLLGISFPGDGGQLGELLSDKIWLAQAGVDYRFSAAVSGLLQLDLHSRTIEHSQLKAFENSLQLQLGLRIEEAEQKQSLDLFFSEDILVGSAPDISFGLRFNQAY